MGKSHYSCRIDSTTLTSCPVHVLTFPDILRKLTSRTFMLHAAWLHEQVSVTVFCFGFPFPLDASGSDTEQQSSADDL